MEEPPTTMDRGHLLRADVGALDDDALAGVAIAEQARARGLDAAALGELLSAAPEPSPGTPGTDAEAWARRLWEDPRVSRRMERLRRIAVIALGVEAQG